MRRAAVEGDEGASYWRSVGSGEGFGVMGAWSCGDGAADAGRCGDGAADAGSCGPARQMRGAAGEAQKRLGAAGEVQRRPAGAGKALKRPVGAGEARRAQKLGTKMTDAVMNAGSLWKKGTILVMKERAELGLGPRNGSASGLAEERIEVKRAEVGLGLRNGSAS